MTNIWSKWASRQPFLFFTKFQNIVMLFVFLNSYITLFYTIKWVLVVYADVAAGRRAGFSNTLWIPGELSVICSERHKVYRYNDKNVLISYSVLFSLINRAMPHVCMLEALAWLYLLVHQYSNWGQSLVAFSEKY